MLPPYPSNLRKGDGTGLCHGVVVRALAPRVTAWPACDHVRRLRGWCLAGQPLRVGLLSWSWTGVGFGVALSARGGGRKFRPARSPVTTLDPEDAEQASRLPQWKQPWSPSLVPLGDSDGKGSTGSPSRQQGEEDETWAFFNEQERPTPGQGGKPRLRPVKPLPEPLPSLEQPKGELDRDGREVTPGDDWKFNKAYGKEKPVIIDVDGTHLEVPSKTTFKEVVEELKFPSFLRANLAERKFFHLTPVQQCGMPLLLQGKDFLASAYTGSGKTAAYLLPILTSLHQLSKIVPDSLVAAHYKLRGGGRSAQPTLGRVRGIQRGLAAIEFEQATGLKSRQLIQPDWIVGVPDMPPRTPWQGPARPFAVVLVPTRELSEQVHQEAKRFTKYSPLRSVPLFGSGSLRSQLRELAHGADILVATPGRLVDVLHRGVCKLDRVKYLVFDETDRMLELGFGGQLEEIMEAGDMATSTGGGRHTSFWSATIPEPVRELAEMFLGRGCIWVDCTDGSQNPVPNTIEHVLVDARPAHRNTRKFEPGNEVITQHGRKGIAEFSVGSRWRVMFTDGDLVQHKMHKKGELSLVRLQTQAVKEDRLAMLSLVVGSSEFAEATIIVFCRRRDTVSEVYKYLKLRYDGVVVCHGGMTQSARAHSVQAIRDGKAEILVSTDMAARGLDMPNISHVVNYELPVVSDEFVHRCGRTGRIGNKGIAVTFVTGREKIFNEVRKAIIMQGQRHNVPRWCSIEGMALPWRHRFYQPPFTKKQTEGTDHSMKFSERRELMEQCRQREVNNQRLMMRSARHAVDEAAKEALRQKWAARRKANEQNLLVLDEEEEEEADQEAGELAAFSRA